MRDAFITELTKLAREDDSVFLVVGDLGFSVIEEFQAEFPDRFLNPGVAEQSMLGIASGLAAAGYNVFVYSIGNFPTMRALEQIRNDVCYHDRAVTVVSVGGGFSYGYLGYTHHAIEDIAVMRALPKMTVYSPADPIEAAVLTRAAVENPGPHYLRLGKNGEKVLHHRQVSLDELERGAVLAEADDAEVVILSTGAIVGDALEAGRVLAGRGIATRVVSVPVIKPLGLNPLAVLGGARGFVTVEEHTLYGGLASAVLERIASDGGAVPVIPVASKEEVVGRLVGSQAYLRIHNGLGVDDIVDAAMRLVRVADAAALS